ncbi:MAG: hypothetical protein LBO02_01890 [Holosporaceae bacterium]|nr:hypothetical protein [Holosporaceae bacterium]
MKKTIGLLSALMFMGTCEYAYANFLSSALNKVGGSNIGQTVSALGGSALKIGTNYAQQRMNVMTNPFRSKVITDASTLQSALNTQIQMMDQQLQNPALDYNVRIAYTNTKQSYMNASVPLGQLVSLVQTAPTTPEGTAMILQQAPILSQQVASNLSNTAYAANASGLLMSVNSLKSSLSTQATGVYNQASGVYNGVAVQAAGGRGI